MGSLTFEAQQEFQLTHTLNVEQALEFLRTPSVSLAKAHFLQNIQTLDTELSGELLVMVPILGQIELPFSSIIQIHDTGANLHAKPHDKHAWLAINGQAEQQTEQLLFHFQFAAYIQIPQTEGWGSIAFEKMVRAAAHRTLERVTSALPESMEQALRLYETDQQ